MDYWEWYRERLMAERLIQKLEKMLSDEYLSQ